MNQFEGIFELFGLTVRRLANGHKIRVVLECDENVEVEKNLIEFRGDNVKIKIIQSQQPENKKDIVCIESVFEVFDIKCRRLRNGDKLSFILEQFYEKESELQLVKLRFNEVNIFMERIDEELFDGQEDADMPEIDDPEGE